MERNNRPKATSPVEVVWKNNKVMIGAGAPIVVQSMTNTPTSHVEKTVEQVYALAQAGSELVRLTVNTPEAARAVVAIRERLDDLSCFVPLVGDFHYNGHKLLKEVPECAKVLSKYRINPGNVGKGEKGVDNFATMIGCAIENDKAVRIGVNWGSLDQSLFAKMMDENRQSAHPASPQSVLEKALVESALQSAQAAIDLGLPKNKIVLSAKVSEVNSLISVYRDLACRCDYALHLGLTEAGVGSKGIVASSAALAVLLQEGIGDTIRISLTPAPGEARVQEVIVAQELLQVMGKRAFCPTVTSCPGCGRTESVLFQQLAQDVQSYLRKRMPQWREQYLGVETMTVAVMGCVVNGPGESKHCDIGISLPGSGESPVAPVYARGEKICTLKGNNLGEQFELVLESFIEKTYLKRI